ncbi:HAD family hydrolase [Marinobacterium sediminicola]|uniref:HAD-superfamily subfamily IB hydrolase, TIGR01490 n=1 Tax=Marinobacterium sediminicola TaxID=518898 RepID=A0ABY1RYW5_9GAMM|nr:HAD family hydrolase [Marinobacterium sediminicola]ULG68086.1 HAD-IB family hydrolase [Marinobacterium sediminicola]SMR73402.1 HAD-superfamily subfamily IB hydrolase, TIGR01490 [Marinobacterium sediminicola]
MRLAIFDLDDTLIDGDSASLFCRFLVEQGLADVELLAQEARLMRDYANGSLDMAAYIRLMTAPIRQMKPDELEALTHRFVCNQIVHRHYPQARQRLQEHREAGDLCLIVSATAEFIVRPVADTLAVEHVLAIELERDAQGCLSGKIKGIPSFREGKVQRLQDWLSELGQTPEELLFYSDSSNDLPLLEWADRPHVVNPDPKLSALARQRGWPVLHWMRANDSQSPKTH